MNEHAMERPTDILIIGGPDLACTRTSDKIRQVPFTFTGLGAAYRLLTEPVTVVIAPDASILSVMPTAADFDGVGDPGRADPELCRLGLYSPASSEPIPLQIESNLALIPEDMRGDFIRRSASIFLGRALDRTFNIVNGGGTVYLLLPEEYPSWQDTDKAVIGDQVPGLIIDRDEAWSARVGGDHRWLLEGVRSGLRLGWANAYTELVEVDGYVGVPDPLPHPDRVLKLLPAEISVSVSQGATDCAGQRRVLALRWGRGAFVVAPALCWMPLLVRLGIGVSDDSGLGCVEDDHADKSAAQEGLKPASAVGPLASLLPVTNEGIRDWDKVLAWRAGKVRSVAEIACSLDALPAGPRRKPTETVRVCGLAGDGSGETNAAALRKLIERKLHITEIPDGLRKLLEDALAAWNQHFFNT